MTLFVKVFLKVRVEITTIFLVHIRSFGNKKLSVAFPQWDKIIFEDEFKFYLYRRFHEIFVLYMFPIMMCFIYTLSCFFSSSFIFQSNTRTGCLNIYRMVRQ